MEGSFPSLACEGDEWGRADPVLGLCQRPGASLGGARLRCLRPADLPDYYALGPKVSFVNIQSGCLRYAPTTGANDSWECSFGAGDSLLWVSSAAVDRRDLDRRSLGNWDLRRFAEQNPPVQQLREMDYGTLGPHAALYSIMLYFHYHSRQAYSYLNGRVVGFTLALMLCVAGNVASVLALLRARRSGEQVYAHQFSLIAADTVSCFAGFLFLILEEYNMLHSSLAKSNYLINFAGVHRASFVQVTLIANALICTGISLDRHQAISSFMAYKGVRQGRRAALMNALAYGLPVLPVFGLHADVLCEKLARERGRWAYDGPTRVCCQSLFLEPGGDEVAVAWLDHTMAADFPEVAGRRSTYWSYETRHSALKTDAMLVFRMAVYGALLLSNVRFALRYWRDRRRAAANKAKEVKRPADRRTMALLLLLSSSLHLLIGLGIALTAQGRDFNAGKRLFGSYWTYAQYQAVEAGVEVLTVFTLLSTLVFNLAISRIFRHHFLLLLRLRREPQP